MSSDFVAQEPAEEELEPSGFFKLLTSSINGKMYTGLIARVLAFNPKGPSDRPVADVQPVIKERFKDGDRVEVAPLLDVPVSYPSGGGRGLTLPLEAGDEVFVSFSDRSIDEWKSVGGTGIEPQSTRRFDLSDGVIVATLNTFNIDPDNLVLGELPTGMQVCIGGGQVSIGTDAVELLSEIAVALNAIDASLDQLSTDLGNIPPSSAPVTNAMLTTIFASTATVLGTQLSTLASAISNIEGITK